MTSSSATTGIARVFNTSLHARLMEYKATGNRGEPYSISDLAKQLGTNTTQVNKYLRMKPEGNVEKLESLIEDMLKAARRREISDVPRFDTNVTKQVYLICEQIRKTNDVGLIHGPAGIGKSEAIAMYLERTPLAIGITVKAWTKGATEFEMALFRSVETLKKPFGLNRGEWLSGRLLGSNRPIVIDNAHRMTKGALAYLFDFHDATKCPIVLVGNPEVLEVIKENDQHYSRIGTVVQLDLQGARAAADKLLHALAPELNGDLLVEATSTAKASGHLRTLKKQILLTRDLIESGVFDDAHEAFLAASTQLIHGQ